MRHMDDWLDQVYQRRRVPLWLRDLTCRLIGHREDRVLIGVARCSRCARRLKP